MDRLSLLWGEETHEGALHEGALHEGALHEWVANLDRQFRRSGHRGGIGCRIEPHGRDTVDSEYAMIVRVMPNGWQLFKWVNMRTGYLHDGDSTTAPGNQTNSVFLPVCDEHPPFLHALGTVFPVLGAFCFILGNIAISL